MAATDSRVAYRGRRGGRRGLAVLGAFAAPLAVGLVLLGDRVAPDGSDALRTFGAATIDVPAGWEAPSSRPHPDPEEAFEIQRSEGGRLVAAAVLLNGIADVQQAVEQNGGVVLNRQSSHVGGQPAELVESTNLTRWRYVDVVIRSAGLTVSLRWDPAREDRQVMDKILSGISLSPPSGFDGPIPMPGQHGAGS